ncbi:MAG: septum formation protein Maf [Lentisphaerae bacterium RIFOXYB12_FULL_65_16]|nr:MAG: septum formation protein Maf [Lentisphaerae bacterium RIFOXYA12_64_32]OGV86571.1 MAG: septum formation protein Maf [Lentisphaerae bacterium RIFOXYB12_FULL_65_16]
MKLVLASASPRRRELLDRAGLAHQVIPASVDETELPGEEPTAHVARLAAAKADRVAAQCPDAMVLGADTVVVLAGRIYGKPADPAEAREMLLSLSGAVHEVLTGVCLVRRDPPWRDAWVCCSHVRFRRLDDALVKRYCALVNTLDKAGAYAVQEHGELLVESVDGLTSNVIGLPIEEVRARLRRMPLVP